MTCGNSKLSGTQKEYIRLKDGSKDKWSSLKVELKTSVTIYHKKSAIKHIFACDATKAKSGTEKWLKIKKINK